MVITGVAIAFNQPSDVIGGAFREIIAPSAVRRTLEEKRDVLGLAHHDPAQVLGRTSSGTLRLRAAPAGLRFALDLPGTSGGRDLVELVGRRDIVGMSFGFVAREDSWTLNGGIPIRTITDMDLIEISAVGVPCYPTSSVFLSEGVTV